MSDKKDDDTKKELAELKAKSAAQDAKIAELEAKVNPPKSTFVPMTDAEHRDWVYQMQERRMSMAMPPSVHQYFADGVTAADCADLRQQARRPTGRPGMIPNQPTATPAKSAGDGTGWQNPIPIGVPGGTRTQELIERQVNAALPHGPEWGKKPKE
jgi:hypothetical protein